MEDKSKINSYRNLIVWQKSMELVVEMYTVTGSFPKSELFGLASQMKRSAVSIPSNIAEGSKRGTRKDFRQFVLCSLGSGAELETQIEIAKRLKIRSLEDFQKAELLLNEIMKMLSILAKKLKS